MKKLFPLFMVLVFTLSACSIAPSKAPSGEIIYSYPIDNTHQGWASLDITTGVSSPFPGMVSTNPNIWKWIEVVTAFDDKLAVFVSIRERNSESRVNNVTEEVMIFERGKYFIPLAVYSLDQLGLSALSAHWEYSVQNPVPLFYGNRIFASMGLYDLSLAGLNKTADLITVPDETTCIWNNRVTLSPNGKKAIINFGYDDTSACIEADVTWDPNQGFSVKTIGGEATYTWKPSYLDFSRKFPIGWLDNDTIIVEEYSPTTEENGSSRLSLYDTSGSLQKIIYEQSGDHPSFSSVVSSPDGRYISYVFDNKQLFVYDMKTGKTQNIVAGFNLGSNRVCNTTWSPDGKWLTLLLNKTCGIYSDEGYSAYESGLYAIKFDGNQIVPLVTDQKIDFILAWYPPIK